MALRRGKVLPSNTTKETVTKRGPSVLELALVADTNTALTSLWGGTGYPRYHSYNRVYRVFPPLQQFTTLVSLPQQRTKGPRDAFPNQSMPDRGGNSVQRILGATAAYEVM